MTIDIAKIQDIEWYSEVPRSIYKQTAFGLFLIVVFFGGFGAWSLTAPLAAAVIAQGSFVATGHNKSIQHLEGGIVQEILVAEGDHVIEGQPLLLLDETAALSRDRQLFLRQMRLEAIVARLAAEESGSDQLAAPPALQANLEDPEVAAIWEGQLATFNSSQAKLSSDIGLLRHNVDSLVFRSQGYENLLDSQKAQRRLLQEEYIGKKSLLDQGFLRAPEVRAVERAIAEAEGNIGRLSSEIQETKSQIDKNEEQIEHTLKSYRQAALEQLQAIGAELDSAREQRRESSNILQRATITAPVSGIVVRLNHHTAGGVIESGRTIAEILPSDVPLIIEAQISRNDIDSVNIGQTATIRLTALNQRTTPVFEGEVFYVSADSLPGESGGPARDVYVARVALPASELARVQGFSPTPGMPAEVLIRTAERTFFDYLSKPIVDSMNRAFMEQ